MVLIRKGFIQYCCVLALIIAPTILYPLKAHAQFLKTGATYQEAGLHAKIIPTFQGAAKGIFGIYFSQSVSLQKFSLQIKDPSALSFFLEFDSNSNKYTGLYIGDKRYSVKGSFALEIIATDGSSLTLKVDNDPNPYSTIVVNSKGKRPSLLAFNGTTEVGNFNDLSAVALMEANQSIAQYADIEPYRLTEKGLLLKGENLLDKMIGLDISPPNNPCLLSGSIFLSKKFMLRIKDLSKEARAKALENEIKRNQSFNPLKDRIVLSLKANEIVALNPVNSEIEIFKRVPSDNSLTICAFDSVKFSGEN